MLPQCRLNISQPRRECITDIRRWGVGHLLLCVFWAVTVSSHRCIVATGVLERRNKSRTKSTFQACTVASSLAECCVCNPKVRFSTTEEGSAGFPHTARGGFFYLGLFFSCCLCGCLFYPSAAAAAGRLGRPALCAWEEHLKCLEEQAKESATHSEPELEKQGSEACFSKPEKPEIIK